ncbi:dTMP kinase [Clostridiaceae bacterium 35-E11]
MMKGLFITVEGPDGSGKTTQIKALEAYLKQKGHDVVITREPGGTKISEQIREIILDKKNKEMDPITEALLYAASRAQHVIEVIKPAVDNNKIVICDRFIDSSIVYQGIGRKLGIGLVENINQIAIQNYMPHITFLFKLQPKLGIERKAKQGSKDRLESENLAFHELVFEGYNMLEKKYPDRIKVIDANQSIEAIHEEMIYGIEAFLKKRGEENV